MINILQTAEDLKIVARDVQAESKTPEERAKLLSILRRSFYIWLQTAKTLAPEIQLEDDLNGSFISPGIKPFLERGDMPYQYYREGNPFTPKWQVNVVRAFCNRVDNIILKLAALGKLPPPTENENHITVSGV